MYSMNFFPHASDFLLYTFPTFRSLNRVRNLPDNLKQASSEWGKLLECFRRFGGVFWLGGWDMLGRFGERFEEVVGRKHIKGNCWKYITKLLWRLVFRPSYPHILILVNLTLVLFWFSNYKSAPWSRFLRIFAQDFFYEPAKVFTMILKQLISFSFLQT